MEPKAREDREPYPAPQPDGKFKSRMALMMEEREALEVSGDSPVGGGDNLGNNDTWPPP
jgi:hypothetical protein